MNQSARRMSYVFLCTLPFLLLIVGGVRALRIPGVYQGIGGGLFAVTLIAAWMLGARVIASGAAGGRRLALAGALLVVPFAVISLLWVGIGAPFQATPTENHMRFLVLLANSIVVAGAFVALKEALSDAGERFYSTLGFAASSASSFFAVGDARVTAARTATASSFSSRARASSAWFF